jgi:S-adenosylmethionine decarboxylase
MRHILFTLKGCSEALLDDEAHIRNVLVHWPENGMAVCDVFTCGDHTVPRAAVTYMYEMMCATDIVSEQFVRPLA